MINNPELSILKSMPPNVDRHKQWTCPFDLHICSIVRWDKLQIFMALARAGNLVRAGRMLVMDATTVGRNIHGLEQELGCTLFERSRDGQTLTSEGRRLLSAVEAMERAATIFRAGAERRDAESGLVRVSVAEGFGTWYVAPRIGQFSRGFPNIKIDLVANSGFLNPSRKEADIAILLARPRKGPLKTRKLADYTLGLYAAVENADPETTLPLVSYIPDFIYAPELNYINEIASGREPSLRSSSINAQAQMIATGAGYGILPCFMGNQDSKLRRIRPELAIQRTFWLAVHQDVSQLPRVRAFIDWIVESTASDRSLFTGKGPATAMYDGKSLNTR
jgi:DNA-binding transcriptional LysR family regulator